MKKIVTICLCLLTAMTVMADKNDGMAHWSIGIKGGVDYYRLPKGYIDGYVKNASWLGGVDVVYDVNPYFGLGAMLDYSSFNRNCVHGGVAEGDIFATVNWANILSAHRQNNWKKFNFYTNIGMGCADGLSKNYYAEDGTKRNDWYGVWTPYTRLGLAAEVTACKWLGIFFEGNYKLYWRRFTGGMLSHEVMFLDEMEANVGLRFRFGAGKKTHIRNITAGDYYANGAKANNDDVDALKDQIAQLKAAQDSANDAANKALDDLKKKADKQDLINANVQGQLNDLKGKIGQAAQNGGSVRLEGVNFAFNSSELTDNSRKILDEVATTLEEYSGNYDKVYVNGYTDNYGSDAINTALSQARAQAVVDYLVKKGLPADKFVAKGYGPTNPIDTNTTAEGRANNRRTELSFSK